MRRPWGQGGFEVPPWCLDWCDASLNLDRNSGKTEIRRDPGRSQCVCLAEGWGTETRLDRLPWRCCHLRPHSCLGGRTPQDVCAESELRSNPPGLPMPGAETVGQRHPPHLRSFFIFHFSSFIIHVPLFIFNRSRSIVQSPSSMIHLPPDSCDSSRWGTGFWPHSKASADTCFRRLASGDASIITICSSETQVNLCKPLPQRRCEWRDRH